MATEQHRSETGSAPLSDTEMRFRPAFLGPKYWPTWLLFALIWLISKSPRPVSVWCGDALGKAHQRFNQKRRRIVEVNLQRCFPHLSQAEREQISEQHYRYFGRSFIDLGLLWWGSEKRLAKLVRFVGEEAYLALLKTNNVILILPHFNGLDLGATYSSTLHPAISMMKHQRNELLSWQLWKGRRRFKPTRVVFREQGLRPLIKATRDNVACYYLPDEDFGDGANSVFAPFFGIPTATLTTLSGMARLARAKVIPVIPRMTPEGAYEVELGEPLEGFPSGDALSDATQMNAVIEAAIRQSPAQYMWTFKWFQTRPAGEASFYDEH